jgi:NADPH:quinone reductase-like Zn-dependent oxidoreductase
MNAAVLQTLGKPPRYEHFPDPVAEEDEVIVHVHAASLKPIDKQLADGSHYAGFRELPVVCGIDGVGSLDDGKRVFFGGPRRPYGSMAERTVVSPSRCFPLQDNIDDEVAAAVFNPGLSAWGTLVWRAQLAPGETVLILGATGVTGKFAIQTARLLGAGRIIAAGRNEEVLRALPDLGADATIRLNEPGQDLAEAFAQAAGDHGFDVIIDYLWGPPTEALLAAITQRNLTPATSRTRLVDVGEAAGSAISLPAAALRSSRLEILGAGTGSAAASPEMWAEAIKQLMANVAGGKLHIDTERVPLANVEQAWEREQHGRRLVFTV